MSVQLEEWQGDFGREYTDRNHVDAATRVPGFAMMLSGTGVYTVLEVGANRGHNLEALIDYLDLFGAGVEPGAYAREQAAEKGFLVSDGSIYEIPHPDSSFDLVFTSGVLIHVPPARLDDALSEVIRVSREYVLAIEYHADEDMEIPYRGMGGMMWNRDYAKHYQRRGLELVRSGDLDEAFDRARYALLRKP